MSYTVFSCPQKMEGVHELRQTNAILSWLRFDPAPGEVLLMGDDPGVPEFAKKHGCRNILVERNKHGTPLVNDIFKRGQEESSNDILIYINADIIMSPNTGKILLDVSAHFKDWFLMCGRRWDCDKIGSLNFEDPKWYERLMNYVKGDARFYLRNHGAIDYWGFVKGFPAWANFPEMYVGRSGWDNLLCSLAYDFTPNTVETSVIINAIHQNIPLKRVGKMLRTPEQIYNRDVYHKHRGRTSGTTKQTTYNMTKDGVIRKR